MTDWFEGRKLSMNFPLYEGMAKRFDSREDLVQHYRRYGLNGLEVILAEDSEKMNQLVTPQMVNGQHLFFHIFWMDWWKGDHKRLDQLFDSRQQWIDYYGGEDPSALLDIYRRELSYAEKMNAEYVVFHVGEVNLEESFTYNFRYSDREVMEASLEIINTLLEEKEYSFDFLVENLWWPGLNLKDTELTQWFLENIHTEKKGIMLDTGHYMNSIGHICSEEEGVECLMELADRFEKAGMLRWIKGVHLHQSLSGSYLQALYRGEITFSEKDFYARYQEAYANTCRIDEHRPFTTNQIMDFLKRIDPAYITFEFQQDSREAYEQRMAVQSRALGLVR